MVPVLVRRKVLAGLFRQGIGRLEYERMPARAEHDLVAFESALETGPMLFGEHFTAADASVASVLATIAGSPSPTGLSDRVRNSRTLMTCIKVVENISYPVGIRT